MATKKSVDALYNELRALVNDNVIISFHDRQSYNSDCVVALEFRSHWTRFEGKDLADAFERAINKLKHPEKDYISIDGRIWKADESSCFHKPHIESFLKMRRSG